MENDMVKVMIPVGNVKFVYKRIGNPSSFVFLIVSSISQWCCTWMSSKEKRIYKMSRRTCHWIGKTKQSIDRRITSNERIVLPTGGYETNDDHTLNNEHIETVFSFSICIHFYFLSYLIFFLLSVTHEQFFFDVICFFSFFLYHATM